jgi:hypothetical protein
MTELCKLVVMGDAYAELSSCIDLLQRAYRLLPRASIAAENSLCDVTNSTACLEFAPSSGSAEVIKSSITSTSGVGGLHETR